MKCLGHTLLPLSVIPSFRQHQFPFIILVIVAHIQLNFDIWIYHMKMYFKFEFGQGLMTFGTVKPLNEVFSFRSLSPKRTYTFKLNLTYGYIQGMRMSSYNLVMVWWLLAELYTFHFENNKKFSVSVNYLANGGKPFNSNLTYGYVKGMRMSIFNCVKVW
jgi:hypothetical protein